MALNETHLQHSDTLNPDMIALNHDRFIVHCDCNNRGGGVALIVNTNLNPKQIRINTILGNSCSAKYEGVYLSCHISASTIYAKHSQTKNM